MKISAAKMGTDMGVHGGLRKSSRSSTNLKEIQILDSCEGSLCLWAWLGDEMFTALWSYTFRCGLRAFLERIIWGGNIYFECGVTISWVGVPDWMRKKERNGVAHRNSHFSPSRSTEMRLSNCSTLLPPQGHPLPWPLPQDRLMSLNCDTKSMPPPKMLPVRGFITVTIQ